MKWSLLVILVMTETCTDLEVLEATSQRWTGGTKQAGSGINYRITFVAPQSSTNLYVDQLWLDNRSLPFRVMTKKGASQGANFSKGDTVIITASEKKPIHYHENAIAREDTLFRTSSPFKYKGAALIVYLCENRKEFQVIESFRVLKPVFYP